MFVRKIQTAVKTCSLQRNQTQLVQMAVPYQERGRAAAIGCQEQRLHCIISKAGST